MSFNPPYPSMLQVIKTSSLSFLVSLRFPQDLRAARPQAARLQSARLHCSSFTPISHASSFNTSNFKLQILVLQDLGGIASERAADDDTNADVSESDSRGLIQISDDSNDEVSHCFAFIFTPDCLFAGTHSLNAVASLLHVPRPQILLQIVFMPVLCILIHNDDFFCAEFLPE